MIQTGVDLVKMARIEAMLNKYGERLMTRLFSSAEQASVRSGVSYYAGRFAAKEAIAKAIGCGIWRHGVTFTDIEILRAASGRPVVRLHGRARERFAAIGGKEISVSISHDGDYAMAFAVAVVVNDEE